MLAAAVTEGEAVEVLAARLAEEISATTEQMRWEQARSVARDVIRRRVHASGLPEQDFDFESLLTDSEDQLTLL